MTAVVFPALTPSPQLLPVPSMAVFINTFTSSATHH